MNPTSAEHNNGLERSYYETPRGSPHKSLSEHSSVVSTDLEVSIDAVDCQWDQLIARLNDLQTCSTHSTGTLIRTNNNPFLCYDDPQSTSNEHISKCHMIQNSLMKIRSEVDKFTILEKNIMTLACQIESMRECLSQQILLISELVQQTGVAQLNHKQFSDAQTQTVAFVPCSKSVKSIENLQSSIFSELSQPQTLIKCDFFTEELKHKLRRLPAMIKGYLVRRLLKTDKVLNLKRTISDTSVILLNFKSNLFKEEKSCKEFYSIFFHYSPAKQMDMINKHRQYLKVALKEKRSSSVLSHSSLASHRSSRATTVLSNHNK